MKVVYAKQEPPNSWVHSIFLAGPTPREEGVPSWRPEAIKVLESLGYNGVVFVPEPEDGDWRGSYDDQAGWEVRWLDRVDRIAFWIPRDEATMPGFTTNVEFGRYVSSGRAVLGYPDGAPKMRYLDWLAGKENVSVHETLRATLKEAVEGWEKRPMRSGGDRFVPGPVWDTPSFQSWHKALWEAGNRIDDAKVLWTFHIPQRRKDTVFSWVMWAKVWIASESRFKENEWVFARTDVSCAVLYYLPPAVDPMVQVEEITRPRWPSPRLLDIEVVIVREFRTPARTVDGFIRELPGGTIDPGENPAVAAAREVMEETGLPIEASRFRILGNRQAAGTLSSHHIFLVGAELNEAEMKGVRRLALSGEAMGEVDDTEQTYVEVVTVRDLLNGVADVDWSTVGLVLRALTVP